MATTMIDNIVSALTGIISAVGSFLTPTVSESGLATAAGVAGIASLFAIPVAIAAGRKAIGLVKSIRG